MALIKSLGYTIVVGKTCFKKLSSFLSANNFSSIFILCDENTYQFCLSELIIACPQLSKAHIIEIESGENSKIIETCISVWETLSENKADRNSLMINLGGGVITDLGGFCASVYKRGIPFVNVPTTLMAMADASVGGKTAIDFLGYKNLVGTFTQPEGVFVYPDFLKTLAPRHIANGLVEIYKIALVCDKSLWRDLVSGKAVKNTEKLLTHCIRLKNTIVLKDPYDKGPRKILNFGHTVGHALETSLLLTSNELLHGEAVIAGMIVECHLSMQKKFISRSLMVEIASLLHTSLKHKFNPIEPKPLIGLMQNDKKSSGNKILFALITGLGSCMYDIAVNEKQLRSAFAYYNSLGK